MAKRKKVINLTGERLEEFTRCRDLMMVQGVTGEYLSDQQVLSCAFQTMLGYVIGGGVLKYAWMDGRTKEARVGR